MRNDNTPNQTGVILFWEENNGEGESQRLHLPAEGSGGAAEKEVVGSYSKIAMSDVPSASTITFSQGTERYLILKTTHRPASLKRTEFQYLMDTYAEGDFISEGLGLRVVEKKGEASGAPIKCHVQLSKSPPAA